MKNPANDPPTTPAQSVHAGKVTNQVDKNQIAQFVTTIRNAEEQVGTHIIQALQHENTVAVITTVAVGQDGKQRVVSAALSPERMQQVQELLQSAEVEREDDEPCVGFHCLIRPKDSGATASEPTDSGTKDAGPNNP